MVSNPAEPKAKNWSKALLVVVACSSTCGIRLRQRRRKFSDGLFETSGLMDQCQCHGSITDRSSKKSKSLPLRVARRSPFARAMAAICASSTDIGRPRRRERAKASASTGAVAQSSGRQRPSNAASTVSAANRNRSRLPPSGNRAMPVSISATTTAERYGCAGRWQSGQAMTAGSGAQTRWRRGAVPIARNSTNRERPCMALRHRSHERTGRLLSFLAVDRKLPGHPPGLDQLPPWLAQLLVVTDQFDQIGAHLRIGGEVGVAE
jgi:hypothetical protein